MQLRYFKCFWNQNFVFQIDLASYIYVVFEGFEALSPNDTIIIREPEYFRQIQVFIFSGGLKRQQRILFLKTVLCIDFEGASTNFL